MGIVGAALLAVLLYVAPSCLNSGPDGDRTTSSYFDIDLTAARNLDATWRIDCAYSLDFPPDEISPEQWITGRFRASSYDWRFVSGESTWVDTVASFQDVTHTVVLEHIAQYNMALVGVALSAPSDTSSNPSHFEGSAATFVRFKDK